MVQDKKGKKRAISDELSQLSEASDTENQPKVKRSKRAETRQCPICHENIPIRLLGKHADLEYRRVEEIMHGDLPVVDVNSDAGPSSGRRGAALRARKSLTTRSSSSLDTTEQVERTIRLLTKNRKQRHAKLKEIIALEDSDSFLKVARRNIQCPICSATLRGDADITDAHIDACIAHAIEQQSHHMQSESDPWEEYEVDGETRLRIRDATALRGSGFHIRDRSIADMDEDVDIDGSDEAHFGHAQFTEQDVLTASTFGGREDLVVDVQMEELDTLKVADRQADMRSQSSSDPKFNLQTQTPPRRGSKNAPCTDKQIEKARRGKNLAELVSALENKIKQLEDTQLSESSSLSCRICLEQYDEPTVSTGCWHTCCRECWLRCLGSTKLCPICKRITAATELRRIYM